MTEARKKIFFAYKTMQTNKDKIVESPLSCNAYLTDLLLVC